MGLSIRTRRWIVGTVAALLVAIWAASYLIDPYIRSHLEQSMNEKLTGYRSRLPYAHLQLLTGVVTLKGLTVVQNAHPNPPVIGIPTLRARVQLRELFFGHVVATFFFDKPKIHINLAQLQAETSNKVPIKHEGWQRALESIYPFKINHVQISDGEFVYVDPDNPDRPLHLEHLYFDADNIRNIHSRSNDYPSPIHARTEVFGRGRLSIEGHADFLVEPFPGIHIVYEAAGIPLSQFDPEIQRANLRVRGGVLDSRGDVEYSPQSRDIEVYTARIDDVNLEYIHSPRTQQAEKGRYEAAKHAAQQSANQPELYLKLDHLEIADSTTAFTDQTRPPGYKLFVSDLDLKVSNLSNQATEGVSHLDLRGKFMGSGDTVISGNFRPNRNGPDFDMSASAENVDLPSLNPFLQSAADLNVKSGKLSVYTQMTVRGGDLRGTVKPMFGSLEVYNSQEEKNRPIMHKAKELAVGAAAKVLKNRSTQKVATDVPITGRLDSPNTSTWEAIVQFARNAFVQAIRPGFDRNTQPS